MPEGGTKKNMESKAMKRLTAVFESSWDYKKAEIWKAFFLSEDFLREQYSEEFVNHMLCYLSEWQQQGDSKLCLPAVFLAELAIAYALTPEWTHRNERLKFARCAEDMPDSFPARELVIKRWNAEMDWLENEYFTEQWNTGMSELDDDFIKRQDTKMVEPEDAYFTELSNVIADEPKYSYHLFRILDQPDCVVRLRAFSDYLRLRCMSGKNEIRAENSQNWSKILQWGQAGSLYEQNAGDTYLYDGNRGACLIALFTFWIQIEKVPKRVLEYMYQEYNLKNIDHSRYRALYVPLKEEILRQYPDIEDALYGAGARIKQIAECFREMARIVSDNHSNYDKSIYEETKEIKDRIQDLFASARWQEFRYDMELFDKIFSQFHFRRVMPETLSKKLIAFYSQEGRWGMEDRVRQLMLDGLIPSLGFNRRVREIEGLSMALDKTRVEDIGGSNPDFWQYFLTWGFGLRKACAEDGKRADKYKRDERKYLPAYMEYTYYPSLAWMKCFVGFDTAHNEITDPVSACWKLPDQRTLRVEFHLHYVLYWLDGQPVHKPEYTFKDCLLLTASLEKVELFFFLLAITSIRKSECAEAVTIVEKWLQKLPIYRQTIPDIAHLLVERCCKNQEENRDLLAVCYMEQERLCIRAAAAGNKVAFYYLKDFAWQEFHKITAMDSNHGEQRMTEFLQALKQPQPVSLGAVSLEGMGSKQKAEQIILALKLHEINCRGVQQQENDSILTESYCVLRYGTQKQGGRVLYCAVNPFGLDLTQRNEELFDQYVFSRQELDKKVKEKHRIAGFLGWGDTYTPKETCGPKPFAVGESGMYYYYQSFHMCRGESLAAILPEMFDLTNVTEVESFQGYLSVSRVDGHLEYCYDKQVFLKSVHSLEKTAADYLTTFTDTEVLMELASWLDRLLAGYEKKLQWVHFTFQYQVDAVCLEAVENWMECDSTEMSGREQLPVSGMFVWKNIHGYMDALKRPKEMLIWYLENGAYKEKLKSSRRIDIDCWENDEPVLGEIILTEQ